MNAMVCVIVLTLPPVDEVVRRFENSLALIHSFECDFRTTTNGKPGISGKYCRRGAEVAIQGISRGQAFSAWCHGGKRWFYNPAGAIKASLLPGTGGDMGQGNVWANALLEVSLAGRHGVPLAELMKTGNSIKCEAKNDNYLVTGSVGEDQFEVGVRRKTELLARTSKPAHAAAIWRTTKGRNHSS